jgi:beta-xylosidase
VEEGRKKSMCRSLDPTIRIIRVLPFLKRNPPTTLIHKRNVFKLYRQMSERGRRIYLTRRKVSVNYWNVPRLRLVSVGGTQATNKQKKSVDDTEPDF